MKTTPIMLARMVVAFSGLFYLFVGVTMLFAPQWFFDVIGNFPPFNRHYLGDLGSFLLPMGIGLLWAARDPFKHVGLIGVSALGSLLHALNHIYDSLTGPTSPTLWFSTTRPLLLLALWLF